MEKKNWRQLKESGLKPRAIAGTDKACHEPNHFDFFTMFLGRQKVRKVEKPCPATCAVNKDKTAQGKNVGKMFKIKPIAINPIIVIANMSLELNFLFLFLV